MSAPLIVSLYVLGTLDDVDEVLADIAIGYFIEKTMDEGRDYCERKINLVKSNFDLLIEVPLSSSSFTFNGIKHITL
ncbi:hypothetical protein PVK06_004386 [Gossypium arboreum]|uniref:Uncharacterized protein n=1 Tax=Gossypium arboreum TaxID=29729 RepID=A0ABR0QSU5_GOSAR|nr:hypothetical protein PVK06_004386 [Gossypium arboreum]